MLKNSELGKLGEQFASDFLTNNGIKIIDKNYFTKFGEIDLIGIENKTIIFIEVKLRSNKNYGQPYESVTKSKMEKIQKSIELYLSGGDYGDFDCRFDIVSLIYNDRESLFSVEWIKNQDFS